MTSLASKFDDVFEAELQEIGNRRKLHETPESTPESSDSRRQSLVGLALSGGGVRSAGVSLGVVQALYRSGFLKIVDYLSTVSGGGYAGAMLSSEIAADTEGISWEKNSTENRLSIDPPSGTGQPGKIYELALYGRRMGDVLKMLSRHLFGWILTIVFLMSGVVCISSILAWLMRQCWSPTGMALLPCFGFNTDIERAFFPAFVAFLLWGGSLIVQRVCQIFSWRIPPTSRVTYVALLSTIVLGILVLMGIEDVGIDDWMELYGLPTSLKNQLQSVIHGVAAAISVGVAATLIPFFSPKSLLNSGRRDSSFMQRVVFNFAGYGVVFALPLFVFFLIARENISNHHLTLQTSNEMSPSRFKDFEKLICELRATSDSPLPQKLLKSLGESDTLNESLNEWLSLNRQLSMDLQRSHIAPLFRFAMESLQPGIAGPTEAEFNARASRERLMEGFAMSLTRNCLSNRSWFLVAEVEGAEKSTPRSSQGWPNSATRRFLQIPLSVPEEEQAHEKSGGPQLDSDTKSILHALESLRRLGTWEAALCKECFEAEDMSFNPPKPLVHAQRLASRQKGKSEKCYELFTVLEKEIENIRISSRGRVDHDYLVWLTNQMKRVDSIVAEVRTQNSVLLQTIYPEYFAPSNIVYARDVNGEDQTRRLSLALWGFLVFVAVGLLNNVNTGSLHGVYRDEISDVWLPSKSLLMKDLDTCRRGGPFHLINCTMNHLSSALDPDAERQSRFIVSHRYCGSKRTGYRKTEEYQDGSLTVADAVAISGAAVTVTAADNLLYRVLLVLTNFRMGQWLRNPAHYHPDHFWPSPIRTMLGLLWDPQDRAFCYVSDGGHLDNTGLAALLERRCKLMICSDASDDPGFQFEDLMHLFQASRAKYKLEFKPLNTSPSEIAKAATTETGTPVGKTSLESKGADVLDQIRPKADSWSQKHFLAFQVLYPKRDHEDASEGLLFVIKSSLTGDEPLDLLELKRRTGTFPHDPTSNQFLAPDRFESYVMLGRHMANDVLKDLGNADESLKLPAAVKAWKDSLNDDNSGQKMIEPTTLHLAPDEPFSEESIATAGLMLNEWKVSSHLEKSSEDGVVGEVSSWARHFESAPLPLRKRFCRHLITIVDENLARVKCSKTATLEFDSMLLMLGKGIPDASRARKQLRAESVVAPEKSSSVS